MAKFVKSNSSGKLEISIRRTIHERTQDYGRNFKVSQSRSYFKEKFCEDWVKVVFNEAADFDFDWIQQELQKAATGPKFDSECTLPIFNFRISSESTIVFLKLVDITLDAFKRNCNKIPHPITGHACDVVVLTVEIPEIPVNLPDRWISLIKDALALRYNSEEKSLNLSKFDEDIFLNSKGLWLSLTRPVIVRAIANLLKSVDNIVLHSLNVSQNNLNHMTHFVPIFEAVPILAFDISDNCIVHRSFLRLLTSATHLRHLTMHRDSGMCGQKLKNKPIFIQELIENCQTLEFFNNDDLKTDIFGGSLRLPSSKQNTDLSSKMIMEFFCDHASKMEANHDVLVDYYSSDSVLSLSIFYHDLSINNRRFNEVYMKNNRNLERLKEESRRLQFIKHGAAQILGFLSEIPKLKHIATSLSLDVIVNTEESKVFCVNGLFVECCKIHDRNKIDNRDSYKTTVHNYFNMRMFSRGFIVVPPGKILQENWTLTNPTDIQFRKFRQQFEDMKLAFESDKTEIKPILQSVKTEHITNSVDSLMYQQESLIQNLSTYSGMNQSFSKQCLQETNWDIEKAKEVFTMAFNNGKIPAEAFVK